MQPYSCSPLTATERTHATMTHRYFFILPVSLELNALSFTKAKSNFWSFVMSFGDNKDYCNYSIFFLMLVLRMPPRIHVTFNFVAKGFTMTNVH